MLKTDDSRVIDYKNKRKEKSFSTLTKIAILSLILFLLSMIPVVYCSFFDYATGDDLLYGSVIKNAMRENLSFFQTISRVNKSIAEEYISFQGAWSVGVLNRMQPGIWGERLYSITPFIAFFSLCFGSGYLLHEVIVRMIKLKKEVFVVLFSVVNFLLIQYMPFPRSGIFWYTGMINYTFSFGLTLIAITWALRYIETGYKRYLIASIISMVYLGGAGLPTIVLSAFVFFILSLSSLLKCYQNDKNRRKMLFYPFIAEIISFIPNALAPGNKARGGADFGFSLSKVVITLVKSVVNGINGIINCICGIKILWVLVIIMFICFFNEINNENKSRFKHPFFATIMLLLTSCTVYAPEMYAGDNVVAGISGGVYDTYYFTYIICLVLWLIYIAGYMKGICINTDKKIISNKILNLFKNKNVLTVTALATIIVLALFSRQMFSNTLDKVCVKYIVSGQLEDFNEQMQERLTILEDSSVKDAVVPEMNSEQGPFIQMSLMRNPNAYTNSVTAQFYGKNSVVALPREEYNRLNR